MKHQKEFFPLPESFEMQFYWSKIETKFMKYITLTQRVDLDAVAVVFNGSNELLDVVYYRKPISDTGAIHHLGDNIDGNTPPTADTNETLKINIELLPSKARRVVFMLNSYKEQPFDHISATGVRLYDTDKHKELWSQEFSSCEQKGVLSAILVEFVHEESELWRLKPRFDLYEAHRIDQVIVSWQEKQKRLAGTNTVKKSTDS